MSGRRLVPLTVLAAGLILCMGCQGRPNTGATSTPPPAAKIPGNAATSAASPGLAVAGPTEKPAAIQPTAPPRPALRISPETFTITADDPGLQLLAARNEGEASRDLTSQVQWTVEPAGLVELEPGGYLRPMGQGVVTVKAALEGQSATSRITLETGSSRSWDFAEDIVPIFTRLGCNTGGCHGKADGQNGFHLSLFGYDRAGDFQALARDGGQRRVSRLVPQESLFLAKVTGTVPHGGGRRLKVGSQEYQTLLAWARDGAPELRGKSHGPVVRLSVEPNAVPFGEPGPRQLRVLAHYQDGHDRDVTRLALYRSNDDAAASVTPQGQVALLRRSETDLVIRYQSFVLSSRLSTVINPGLVFDFSKVKLRNFIDDELLKRLESLKVPPSPPAGDAAFLRRVSLDLTGEQPPPEEIRRFLADQAPDKRVKLIDRLIASPEFVAFWRIKLGDLLQISAARQNNGAYRYQAWIDHCLKKNEPWDEVVRALLTAVGDPTDIEKGGPVNYAMDAIEPNVQAELTAQRFLGLRIRCAQCHDHPFDVWTQDAYFGLASFFAKVQRGGAGGAGAMMGRAAITINPKGQVVHLRTKQPVEPRLLDGKPVTVAASEDPRKSLAAWMTAPDNPYFARATANWVWSQLFGKGLVDPPDDMSRANPPVHPELLDALARHFVASKFNLRDLVRDIAVSETYGLSSATVPGNERDTRLFSHQLARPLTAHQMADALAQATDVPNRFAGVARRVIELPDPMAASTILDTFGRCPRTVTCASTPAPALSLRQALLLIGGDVIESKVASLNGYLSSALKLELEPEELVENLYFRTVCRPPTAEEISHWAAELKQASSKKEAAEDLFWALLNSREFAFNH
jgi:Protein of unknown function (DUF1553)/Protein of unknown function (DUF1549)